MIISHKHKFIMFCSPKTGTNSMEAALAQYHDDGEYMPPGAFPNEDAAVRAKLGPIGTAIINSPQWCNLRPVKDFRYFEAAFKHCPPWVVSEVMGEDYWDFTTFMFCRNPWDWVVSQYFYNFFDAGQEPFTYERLKETFEKTHQYSMFPAEDGLYQYQYYVEPCIGAVLVNFVGRVEDMQDDFDVICKQIGIPTPKLKRLNSTQKKEGRKSTVEHIMHDRRNVEAIQQIYARDFDLFRYSTRLTRTLAV